MSIAPQKIIAIIPARGGSKGIPGKNMRLVGGKPLLAWSIEQARQTPQISGIFVSTDSVEIAAIARDHGAEIIMRPPEISGDTASSESSLVHALDTLQNTQNIEPTLVVFLQATSPLRKFDDIQKAIETLEQNQADSLFSACRVEGFVWRVEKDGRVRSFSYDHLNRPRRQDAPEDLVENGSIYIFKPWVLRQLSNRLGGKIAVYRMPSLDSFQIDELADIELIEAVMAFRAGSRTSSEANWAGYLTSVSMDSGVRIPISDLESIKMLVLDFDGVLTDNRVMVTEDGREAVWCSRSDGLGLELLKGTGVEVVVISKEKNSVVSARCQKLGIECIQGCDDKLNALRQRAQDKQLKAGEISYVGNDINDLECLRWVGLPIAVCDAIPEVLAVARWSTTKPGGLGAVREICDLLVQTDRKR